MELSQPRPLGTESSNKGRKAATHDFLSLYSSSTSHQDPTTPSQGNNYLKTHDFLQPLEKKNTASKEAIEKPSQATLPFSVERVLPSGIESYGISYSNQRPSSINPADRGTLFAAQMSSSINTVRSTDENSNSSSYLGSTFTIWDASSAANKKGKTGKENIASERYVLSEAGLNWPPSVLEKPSQSSSSNHKRNASTFCSFSSSQPSSSQKNHSFIDMITSAKNDQDDEDDDDDEEFVIKKEPTSQSKGNLCVKLEAKTMDQKPSTPRSKHSATEQRRRSKINDRFQKLREIIPNSDQKRDKASFLLEVVEYIQFLQEKVNRYEGSYNVWNHETSKMMQFRNGHDTEGFIDHARGLNTASNPALAFVSTKFEDKKVGVLQSIPINGKNVVHSDMNTKDQYPQAAQTLSFGRTNMPTLSVSPNQTSDTDKTSTWPSSPFLQQSKMNDQELTVESGTINISSVYSQGLLNTLTKALQSSGVDLSQARISVQIDLGKRLVGVPNSETCNHNTEDGDITASVYNSGRGASADEDFGQALKRLKTSFSN